MRFMWRRGVALRFTAKVAALAAFLLAVPPLWFSQGVPWRAAAGSLLVPETDPAPLERHDWPFARFLGFYDRPSAQRGLQIYLEVCSACHGLSYVRYSDLRGLGYDMEALKALAAGFQVTDGPNDEGEMFERAAQPRDAFAAPFPNEQAARAANGGSFPPDLSLLVKARENGADYAAALLKGYRAPPPAFKVVEGRYYNIYFPGRQLAMPPPLFDNIVTYADGTPATVQQMSYDVAMFLAWAADPGLETRNSLGGKVVLFLFFLTFMLLAVKKRVWHRALLMKTAPPKARARARAKGSSAKGSSAKRPQGDGASSPPRAPRA